VILRFGCVSLALILSIPVISIVCSSLFLGSLSSPPRNPSANQLQTHNMLLQSLLLAHFIARCLSENRRCLVMLWKNMWSTLRYFGSLPSWLRLTPFRKVKMWLRSKNPVTFVNHYQVPLSSTDQMDPRCLLENTNSITHPFPQKMLPRTRHSFLPPFQTAILERYGNNKA